MFQSVDELANIYHREHAARRERVYDIIATVAMGTVQWTQDERPLVKAVEEKYEQLRQVVFSHVLALEHGLSWFRYVWSTACPGSGTSGAWPVLVQVTSGARPVLVQVTSGARPVLVQILFLVIVHLVSPCHSCVLLLSGALPSLMYLNI